jgi:ABC-type sugar transport system ATPase subunit
MVAGFVGSPQMNLLEGGVDTSGAVFQCMNVRLDLTNVLKKSLAQRLPRSLTIGIRAEDFAVADPAAAWITGDIDLVEDLGSDRYLRVKCDRIELVVRAGRELNIQRGDRIGLNVRVDRMHFFADGKRYEL